MSWLVVCLSIAVDWFVNWLVGWLAGWLVGWFVCLLVCEKGLVEVFICLFIWLVRRDGGMIIYPKRLTHVHQEHVTRIANIVTYVGYSVIIFISLMSTNLGTVRTMQVSCSKYLVPSMECQYM